MTDDAPRAFEPDPADPADPTTASRAARLDALIAAVRPTDPARIAEAVAHHDRLTKPRGSLGRLESLGAQLCAISDVVPPPIPERPAVAVFAADHGVHAQGVSPWPQEVTAQMVANFCAGGAAINVLAGRCGATVTVVDVGVAADLPDHPRLLDRKVRRGSADLSAGPALLRAEAIEAILVGVGVASELIDAGADLLVGGDMGIANTTASAAVIGALTGRPAVEVTGRGTGIDDATLAHKAAIVEAALARLGTRAAGDADEADPAEAAGGPRPLDVLCEVGGLEIAALAGFYLAAAAARVPAVADGVIALAGLCVAAALAPPVLDHVVAGHRSIEPGASAALAWLGLEPLVDLELRLGEGTGAALAVPLVQAAAAIMREMATFDAAGVIDKAG